VGAVIVNLTVTGTAADGYLTTWPAGEPRPGASSLNFAAGQTVANLVVAQIGANGSILDLEQQRQPRHATDARHRRRGRFGCPREPDLGH